MYLGRIVETAMSRDLNTMPLHPYTVALLSAIPVPDPVVESRRRRIILTGDVPSPANPPSGCRFHTRCWLRERLGNPERCATEDPLLRVLDTRHEVACHFAEEVAGSAERALATGKPTSTAMGGTEATPIDAVSAAALAGVRARDGGRCGGRRRGRGSGGRGGARDRDHRRRSRAAPDRTADGAPGLSLAPSERSSDDRRAARLGP